MASCPDVDLSAALPQCSSTKGRTMQHPIVSYVPPVLIVLSKLLCCQS